MSKRKMMPRNKDRKVFRRTAAEAKKINVEPVSYRGGIRL